MSTQWVTRQILAIQRVAEPTRFNPRPAGLMLHGSTTHAIHEWLSTRNPSTAWWPKHAIAAGTGRNYKTLDWGLLYLLHIGAIERCADYRHCRYMKYRILNTTARKDEGA